MRLLWILTIMSSLSAGAQERPYRHAPGAPDAPMLVLLPNGPETVDAEFKTWAQIAASRKWTLVVPAFPLPGDAGLKQLETWIPEVRATLKLEKSPCYLVGTGNAAALVFYAAARVPHLWTAAVAVSGSPKPAVDSDRIFGANTMNVPVGWAVNAEERGASDALRGKMIAGGYNLTVLESATVEQLLDFFAKHRFDAYPASIDCETGNPQLARCYWVTVTAFDPALRNDAIRSTRIAPDNLGASLDFGGFGFKTTTAGPGVLVEFLPDNYNGPLKLNDRIVALSGKQIIDAKHYIELMSQVTEERPVSVTIDRIEKKEKDRIRLTTYYKLRKREEVITARLQASYSVDAKEITIISRAVAELQIRVPGQWVPATITWNGNQMAAPQQAGCLVLSLKTPGAARPCPQ
ncbi:MAG: hypothetical protein JNL98_28615 [Bryobacterales bacterium]|nr:hypothetical protein [Bryobacterales bacterium]